MIPTFPEFKKLEWGDREAVQQFTSNFQPYSDFNFVSMWAWNTREKMMLSQLHGNLILLFYDYITELPFLSFIGTNKVSDTVHSLLDHSILHYSESRLKLIPEEVAAHLCESEFNIASDVDSHDYIVPITYLSTISSLPRSSDHAARNCKRFLNTYPGHSVKACTIEDCRKDEYIELFKRWAKIKNLDHWELNEYSAFEKFIENKDSNNNIVSLHDGDKIMAFATYEILPQKYAICHFAKADRDYSGVYDGLFFTVAKILRELGIEYWNFEQDLGIPGLRQSKMKYKPEFFLKKFIIEKKSSTL